MLQKIFLFHKEYKMRRMNITSTDYLKMSNKKGWGSTASDLKD